MPSRTLIIVVVTGLTIILCLGLGPWVDEQLDLLGRGL